jgi:magnesium-protoporphyrin O-methyltransferase
VEGKTLLEVGGGIGAIQIELLKAGARHALSVELTPTYEEVAARLLLEHGLSDRVERRVTDFAETATEVEGADIVVLNRVICCYPDMPKLTAAAAVHAGTLLVMSYPRRAWWTRVGLGLSNALLVLFRREFHIFVHPPQQITATARREGLEPVLNRQGPLWTVTAMRRTAS